MLQPPRKRLRRLADLEREGNQKGGQDSGNEDLEIGNQVNTFSGTGEKEFSISNTRRTRSRTAALQKFTTSTSAPSIRTGTGQGPVRSGAGIESTASSNGYCPSKKSAPSNTYPKIRNRPARKTKTPEFDPNVDSKTDIYEVIISDDEGHGDQERAVSRTVTPQPAARNPVFADNPEAGHKKTGKNSAITNSIVSEQEKPLVNKSSIKTFAAPYSPDSSVTTLKNFRPITTFFGRSSTQHVFNGSQPQTQWQGQVTPTTTPLIDSGLVLDAKAQASLIGVSNLEDLLDDLSDIDDFTDDEDLIPASRTGKPGKENGKATLNPTQLSVPKRPSDVRPQTQKQSPAFLPIVLKRPNAQSLIAKPTPSPLDFMLPWPMKHTPATSAALAIHPKKVSELALLLGDLREGYSMKRVLLLRGPTGCGKTVTLQTLAKEIGWEIVEWVNPSTSTYSSNPDHESLEVSGSSFASAFEDWLFRSGKWGCLDLVSDIPPTATYPQEDNSSTRKLLLVEDLPNLSHSGTLLSFRSAIRAYLSVPRPHPNDPPIPPLVIMISECSEGAGSSTNMGMTAYRIFGTPILSHPLVGEVNFRKVAKTLLIKCLEEILKKEGFQDVFGGEILEQLAESGDLRGAISGLEVLLLGRERKSIVQLALGVKKKAGGKSRAVARSKGENIGGKEMNEMLNLLNPRFSTFGLFHTIGKVVYNKRYGDDPSDRYINSPHIPPLALKAHHRYHERAMKLDPNNILDESGVDANMFVYGVQENYLGSCTTLGGKPGGPNPSGNNKFDILQDVCFCAEGLSDGDVLMGMHSSRGGRRNGDIEDGVTRPGSFGWGVDGISGGSSGVPEGVIRQEEIAAQVVVRSLALGLPSPVKRESITGGGGNRKGGLAGGNKMYYPMGLRLWKKKEEIEGCVAVCMQRILEGRYDGLEISQSGNSVHKETNLESQSVDGQRRLSMVGGLTRAHLVIERLPFMTNIARAGSQMGLSPNQHRSTQANTPTMINKWGIRTINHSNKHLTNINNTSYQNQYISGKGDINFGATRIKPFPRWILQELEKATVINGLGIRQIETEDEDYNLETWKRELGEPEFPDADWTYSNRMRGEESRSAEGQGSASHSIDNEGLLLVEDDIVDDW